MSKFKFLLSVSNQLLALGILCIPVHSTELGEIKVVVETAVITIALVEDVRKKDEGEDENELT